MLAREGPWAPLPVLGTLRSLAHDVLPWRLSIASRVPPIPLAPTHPLVSPIQWMLTSLLSARFKQDGSSAIFCHSTEHARDASIALPFAADDAEEGPIGSLCATMAWTSRSYTQKMDLRRLRGLALQETREAPFKIAGRRVPPVKHVSGTLIYSHADQLALARARRFLISD